MVQYQLQLGVLRQDTSQGGQDLKSKIGSLGDHGKDNIN